VHRVVCAVTGHARRTWPALVAAPLIAVSTSLAFDEPAWILLPAALAILLLCMLIQDMAVFLLAFFPLLCFHHVSQLNLLFAVFGVLALLLGRWVERDRQRPLTWLELGLLAIATLAYLPVLRVDNQLETTVWWAYDFLPLVLYVLLCGRLVAAETLRHTAKLFVVIASVAAVTVIADGLLHPHVRAVGLVDSYPTGVAFDLVPFFPIALGLFGDRDTRILGIAGSLLILLALFFTGTRMPFFIACLSALPFFKLRHAGLYLFIGLGILFAMQSGGGLVSRYNAIEVEQGVAQSTDASTVIRLLQWVLSLKILQVHGWLGIGFGQYREMAQSLFPDPTMVLGHSHNALLEKMVQVGIPVALFYFCVISTLIWINWRCYFLMRRDLTPADERLLLGFGLGACALLACGVSDAVLSGHNQPILFWMVMACWSLFTRIAPRPTGGAPA
jgi:hypothetical protein